MSVVRTGYQRKCDNCGAIHVAVCSSPRRAMAAARRDGWQRREVVVGQHEGDEREWMTHVATGESHYVKTGRRKMFDERAWRDLCPTCLDRMEATP